MYGALLVFIRTFRLICAGLSVMTVLRCVFAYRLPEPLTGVAVLARASTDPLMKAAHALTSRGRLSFVCPVDAAYAVVLVFLRLVAGVCDWVAA